MTASAQVFIVRLAIDFTVILLWILLRFRFRYRYAVYVALTLPGTLAHELMHWSVALVTNGKPARISIIPQRRAGRWTLGHVTLKNPRWYNTGAIALAPLGLPLLAYEFYRHVALYRPLVSMTHWLFLYLIFEMVASALPSREDISLVRKTHGIWLILIIVGFGFYWHFTRLKI